MFNVTMFSSGNYSIWHENGIFCGDFITGDDGYYAWWPPHPGHTGYWAEEALRELADKLKELNAAWHKTVMEDPNI